MSHEIGADDLPSRLSTLGLDDTYSHSHASNTPTSHSHAASPSMHNMSGSGTPTGPTSGGGTTMMSLQPLLSPVQSLGSPHLNFQGQNPPNTQGGFLPYPPGEEQYAAFFGHTLPGSGQPAPLPPPGQGPFSPVLSNATPAIPGQHASNSGLSYPYGGPPPDMMPLSPGQPHPSGHGQGQNQIPGLTATGLLEGNFPSLVALGDAFSPNLSHDQTQGIHGHSHAHTHTHGQSHGHGHGIGMQGHTIHSHNPQNHSPHSQHLHHIQYGQHGPSPRQKAIGQIPTYRTNQQTPNQSGRMFRSGGGDQGGQGTYYGAGPAFWTPPYTLERKKGQNNYGQGRLSLNPTQAGPTTYTPPSQGSINDYYAGSPLHFGNTASGGAGGNFGTGQFGLATPRGNQSTVPSFNLQSSFTPLRIGFRPGRSQPEFQVARSATLEDFRLTKQTKRWSLKDIYGHMSEFCGDQHGSRFIQHKLEECTPEEGQAVFDEIIPNAFQLMTDVFGNYVVQKMFELGDQRQKAALAKQMEGRIYELSMQMYGCRVVQEAFQHVLVDQRDVLVAELEPHVLECVKSSNANHVIQLLIQLGASASIPRSFLGHIDELATHPFGCRVLQRTFETDDVEFKKEMMEEFDRVTELLIEDQFGNYVVQTVIECGTDEDRARVIAKIKGRMVPLSRHKFASNVCERALTKSSGQDLRDLILELIDMRPDGNNNIRMLLQDAFGNFPLQTALRCAEADQRDLLLSLIRPILPAIYHSPVGKRLSMQIATWERDGVLPPTETDTDPDQDSGMTPKSPLGATTTVPGLPLNPSQSLSSATTPESGYTPLTESLSLASSPKRINATDVPVPSEAEKEDKLEGDNVARGDRGGIRTLNSTPTGRHSHTDPQSGTLVPSQVSKARGSSGGGSGGGGAWGRTMSGSAIGRGSPVQSRKTSSGTGLGGSPR